MNPSRAKTLCALLLLASAVTGQVAYFPDNAPAAGTSNTIPYNSSSWNTAGYTSYHVYPAATLTAAGVPAGAYLSDLAIAPTSTTGASGTINIPITQVYIGHLANNPPTAGQWLNNVAAPVVLWDTTIDGPLTFGWTADTWVSHPIACHGASFAWDGLTDVIFYQTHAGTSFPGGGFTGGFSIHSGTGFTRHGLNAYTPTIGTAPSTTSTTLGMKMRMTFSANPCFALVGGTSGAGAGDLNLSLIGVPPAITEGYTLLTATPVGAPGTGPFFGIWVDPLTFSVVGTAAGVGNPLHFLAGAPGIYPDGPVIAPPGTLSFLAGQVWDAVVVALGPGLLYLDHTNVVRLSW
jgi:hypothetical protein